MPESGKYWYKPLIDKSTQTISSAHAKNKIISNEQDILAIWRTLTLRVSHEPENLKLHAQRLLFALENNIANYISGALQDLFICLGSKGFSLRQRMFNLTSPVMVQSDRIYFQRWLMDDTDKNLACERFLGAVFKSETCQSIQEGDESKGLNTHLVFKNQLAEARYNLEAGQIVKGQALLENYYIKNENDSGAMNELQNVYSYTKNKDALINFTQKLSENSGQIPSVWATLLNDSNSW